MTQSQITRKNHYVPIWYQKRFIRGSSGKLKYLDLHPEERPLPNGKTILPKNPRPTVPKQCFYELDLYTTRFGSLLNDEVERHLFGRIDSEGAIALRAFVDNDQRHIHEYFQTFFEYMDAQKLRTPKGLDWLNEVYGGLSQLDLMVELQHVRQMHCTMWFEAVREIVSAEDSDVKFIVSDHPITSYNAACPPESQFCQYPNDPTIEFVGTQSIFPLSADYCLILTNLEYAQQRDNADHLALRQNARRLGQTIARTDNVIRTRKLTSDQVWAINRVLKARSRRYIAAIEKDWLYPEKTATDEWAQLGEVLIPPKGEIWRFGGEIYYGNEDGMSGYQDAFGRTDPRHEFLEKELPSDQRLPNDMCPCGSGRRFKKCCLGIAKIDHPPWNVFSIRERNLMFCNAVNNILGLNKDRSWDDIRRELTDDEVRKIHEILELLWPPDTNIADLLPRPDSRVFRAIYIGPIDPRTIAISVLSNLAYVDEIIIPNPFSHPGYMKPEFSPTTSPSQHKSSLLKNVMTLLVLEPFIRAGIVHLVTDPMEFSSEFRRIVMPIYEDRRKTLKVEEKDFERHRALSEDDFKRQISRLPDNVLRDQIRDSQPEIAPELLEGTVRHIKDQLQKDPLALLQPIGSGEESGELLMMRGISLETALFFASLTGAAILTDEPAIWRILHEDAAKHGSTPSDIEPLVGTMRSLRFPVDANPNITLEARHLRKLSYVRRTFRRLASTAEEISDKAVQILADRLHLANRRAKTEWDACDTEIVPALRLSRKFGLSVPKGGFTTTQVRRLLVFFGRHYGNTSASIALFATEERSN